MPQPSDTHNVDLDQSPRFIAIEGCIGVGKTSLATRLAETLESELLLEKAEDNPFLPKFYVNKKDTALSTQLFFLLQRAEQLKSLRQSDLFSAQYVADFLIDKDPLFANINLSSDEFDLYKQVFDNLTIEAPTPDLIIYLQAPIDVLKDRIRSRGRRFEQHIDTRYLEQINKAYSEYFYYYDASPLLILNVAELDFINNEEHYAELVQYALTIKSGRHYFNPTFFSSQA
ncbi:MAG: deoxynucleoside kinase [Pseudomonadota bacterium]